MTTSNNTPPDAAELRALVLEFTEAFNRDDLDGVLSFFTAGAFYDEFHGGRSLGVEAIRKAFEPQFAGRFGRIRFETEDVFADPETATAAVRWRCVIEKDGQVRAWRGLDVLGFEGRKIAWKETYAKAPVPALQAPGE